MISQYLQSMEGIEILGAASLCLSLVVFLGIVVWAVKADRAYVRMMEQLPLEDDGVASASTERRVL
jgi:hypothetical protein